MHISEPSGHVPTPGHILHINWLTKAQWPLSTPSWVQKQPSHAQGGELELEEELLEELEELELEEELDEELELEELEELELDEELDEELELEEELDEELDEELELEELELEELELEELELEELEEELLEELEEELLEEELLEELDEELELEELELEELELEEELLEEGHVTEYADLTTRNPIVGLLASPGNQDLRTDERTFTELSSKLPPRTTRRVPVVGPVGSIDGLEV